MWSAWKIQILSREWDAESTQEYIISVRVGKGRNSYDNSYGQSRMVLLQFVQRNQPMTNNNKELLLLKIKDEA